MTYRTDPMLPHYTDHCKCTTCGEYFNSSSAFDYHREGSYTAGNRRCLTTDEMRAKGMVRLPTRYWIKSQMQPEAVAAKEGASING